MYHWCLSVLRHSVVSDSLWSHGLPPVRLLCPWGFSRQEHWTGLPCPPPGDLPDPGMEPASLVSPSFQADSYCWTTRKAWYLANGVVIHCISKPHLQSFIYWWTQVASTSWQLSIILIWTSECRYLFKKIFFSNIYPGVKLLGHVVGVFFFLRNNYMFF